VAPDTPQAPPAVVVEGVSKRFRLPHERTHTLKERALHPFRKTQFDALDALHDVTFDVRQGEFFGIVGRNGSGKSTLLKCLAGIYRVDRGSIGVAGRMSTFIELGVGFNPDLAAYDNVVTNAIMLGLTPREATERFENVIAFAELEEFVDLKIKNYSSGMLVRLAFATAIEAEADVLLIDEVLAVGDASFQQKCFDVFSRLRQEGRTMILVTHDMSMVERLCDRAMLMERGRAVSIDNTESIARRYLELNFDASKRANAEQMSGRGDGTADIEEVWVTVDDEPVSTSTQGDTCTIHARVRFDAPVEDPMFNTVLVNERRVNVTATSNFYDEPSGRFEAGETAEIRASFENHLAPGRYQVSVVVYRGGMALDILHAREEAADLMVTATQPQGGVVDLPFTLSVTRGEARIPS
jgi:ABC-type polysaccharide/polyol phosphate transport system ATPase subunit